jgi:hypothetical protein
VWGYAGFQQEPDLRFIKSQTHTRENLTNHGFKPNPNKAKQITNRLQDERGIIQYRS